MLLDLGDSGMMTKFGISLAVIAASLLVGCGGNTGKILGLEKEAPDEFLVVTRAPLSMPPDFGLRPPEPGAARIGAQDPGNQASSSLFGATAAGVAATTQSTPGELSLLTNTGAMDANPDIRLVVDQESAIMAVESDTIVEDLLFWKDPNENGTIVDANAEQQRLQENTGLGNPVTEGDTPMITRESDGGGLLDMEWPF